ncbi:nucleolar complex protein 14 [Physocladia obscura]|uniref:Nucleolar complex protein 14 n=1 Tax=Physocladia obscura TaxID=109957 RepID=A0AAD5XCT6_9FUNG|nr:nucleolar complex protein 14 [Physocladia obscura]
MGLGNTKTNTADATRGKKGASALTKLRTTLKTHGVVGAAAVSKKQQAKNNSNNATTMSAKAKAKLALRALDRRTAASNPFELQFAKEKHSVLNRNVKGTTGKPLLQRRKAEEIRKKSLAVELSSKHRSSAFVDKRFGENNPSLSVEDKMMERFMKEKTRSSRNSSLFNLEEEDLTHLGQSISGMDDYTLESGLERVEDDDEGNIDKSTVKFSHFGGFEDDNEEHKKSKNEIMAEVIAKSKFHKHERQKLNEEVLQMAQEVDDDLDNIKSLLMGTSKSDGKSTENEKNLAADRKARKPLSSQDDGYDKFIRELRGDTSRAAPTNRLKTDEEKAMDEKAELEKLEAERLERMKGPSKGAKKRNAQGDDLDDDFGTVANAVMSRSKRRDGRGAIKEDSSDKDEDDNDEYEANRNNGKDAMPLTYSKDGILINKNVFMRKRSKPNSESGDDEDESGDDDDEDKNEENDEDDDEVEDNGEDEAQNESLNLDQEDLDSDKETDDVEDTEESLDEDVVDKTVSKKISEVSEIPFTFISPENHADLLKYLDHLSPEGQATVIHRIRVLYHVKLGGSNRSKLENLLRLLFEHLQYLSRKSPADIETINALSKHIHELSIQFPEITTEIFLRKIKKLHNGIQTAQDKSNVLPWIDDLVFLKTIPLIFSVSDFDHLVGTRASLLMSEYLIMSPTRNGRQSLSALILCQILREFVKTSKRYVPEVINCLSSILEKLNASSNSLISIDSLSSEPINLDLAVLLAKPTKHSDSELFQCKTGEFKMALLITALNLVGQYSRIYSDAPAFIEMFSPLADKMQAFSGKKQTTIINEKLAAALKANLDLVRSLLASAELKRKPLQLQKRKAIAIQTYVPKFEEHYSLDRRGGNNKERNEVRKVKTEYKKEFKGAVRELRKDGQFIARQRLVEKAEKDQVYKKKMDRIVGDLANLEGAMRGYERKMGKTKK